MSNNAYFVSMQAALVEHRRFKEVWKKHWPFAPRKAEPADVTKARQKFQDANESLWIDLLYPLQSRFDKDRESAIDEVIDFLEIDIPAFRCGYLKEYFLDHIKANDLTDVQKSRLRRVALILCETNTVRREFRRWVKLMIAIVDNDFVDKCHSIATAQTIESKRATTLMLESLSKHRKRI